MAKKENTDPKSKRRRLSLSLKKNNMAECDRFADAEALRKYESVTEGQEIAVSKILSGETTHYEPSCSSEGVISTDSVPIVSTSSVSTASAPVMHKDCIFNSYSCVPPTVPQHSYGPSPPYLPMYWPYDYQGFPPQ